MSNCHISCHDIKAEKNNNNITTTNRYDNHALINIKLINIPPQTNLTRPLSPFPALPYGFPLLLLQRRRRVGICGANNTV